MTGDGGEYDDDLHRFDTAEEAFRYLRYAGTLSDAALDLGECALAQALVFLPGLRVDRYRQHLLKLQRHVAEEYNSRLRMNEEDGPELRAQVLRKIIHDAHGYEGDDKTYDDLQNANLIRVIERRKGMPVALGLIYVILGRAQGWHVDGLNFPGHFLVRIEASGRRIILDPFRKGEELDAAGLRQLLKSVAGQGAELAHAYTDPSTNRGMLIRLQNNIKNRLIEHADYAQALLVIEAMEALAPEEYRILFDKAVLYIKLEHAPQAIRALERYIEQTPDARERRQAGALLSELRGM